MSFTLDIQGDREIYAALDKLDEAILGIGGKIANDIADWIVIETKNNIVEMDLYDTGELWDSVNKVNYPNSVVISVDAPYAKPLEDGARPSPGRYVPDIERRLVEPTRRVIKWGTEDEEMEISVDIGTHPGNKAYHFFQNAIDDVLAYTDEDWLREHAGGFEQ